MANQLWRAACAAGALVGSAFAASSSEVCPGYLSPTDVAALDYTTWGYMIKTMGQQKSATEEMAKMYLQIRKEGEGDGAVKFKNDLVAEIKRFDDKLTALLTGTGDYSKPPSDVICDGLLVVKEEWNEYKKILEPAVKLNEEVVYDDEVMGNLTYWQEMIEHHIYPVEKMYVSLAAVHAPKTAGNVILLAEEQCMLTQKMAKEALLIDFKYEYKRYLEELSHDKDLFNTNHQALLKGLNSMGLKPLAKRCTLWEMRKVTDEWEHMEPWLQAILDTEHTTPEGLKEIAKYNELLLTEMTRAVELYMKDYDTQCKDIEYSLNFDEWANGINEAGRGQMFSQKSTRLILQIAQPNPANLKVDQDELVDTLAIGLWTLNTLIEGSVKLTVPALPTQLLVEDFVAARETWKKFSSTLTANMQILPISDEIIDRVADLRETYFNQMAATVMQYVQTAFDIAPTVHSEVIFIAGRQRTLQCKLASEALLVDLGSKVDHHRKLAADSIELYLEVHWKLLKGEKNADGTDKIVRTQNICMLRQMLTVIDSFSRIRGITGLIMESSKDTSSKADLQSFHEIINAGYGIMNAAVEMYIAGKATCDLKPHGEEWDMTFAELGQVRTFMERVTKDFLFTMKKMNTTDGDIYLPGSMEQLEETMHKLTYGNTAELVTTPPTQKGADKLFAITDAYEAWKAKLVLADSREADGVLEDVVKDGEALTAHVQEMMELYVDDAWNKDKSVEAAKLNATSTLNMLIERAQKQTVLLTQAGCPHCLVEGAKLKETVALFEHTYDMLVNGHSGTDDEEETRRLAAHEAAGDHHAEHHNGTKFTITAINQGQLFTQLRAINNKWRLLKPKIEKIITDYDEEGDVPSITQVVEVADLSKAVSGDSDTLLYSASTRTTTSVPLHILTPLPLTGSFTGGKTMRTAAQFAEDVINQQQKLLPGFAIRNRFFDDKCNSDEGMRLVLQESASATIDYVALGGVACSHVCASAAFAAASMNMPFLSYECAARDLSNAEEYPGFTRMGTPLVQAIDFFNVLVERYEWSDVAVVTADPAKYRSVADYYEAKLLDAGIPYSNYASFDFTIAETVSMAASVVADNRRVIVLAGDEQFMRRAICGTIVAGAPMGIAWVWEGVQSESWWTVDDADLIEEHAACTGVAITQAFRNALNIAGVGKALSHEEELPLDCFDGYTSKSFLAALDQHILDGYPLKGDNETMVEKPHTGLRAHSADAVCALAKVFAMMRADQNDDEQFIEGLRNPTVAIYQEVLSHLKKDLLFQGVSGWVNFTVNDKPETISLKQIHGDHLMEVGVAFPNGSMLMDLGMGIVNNTWVTDVAGAESLKLPALALQALAVFLCALHLF